MNFLISPPPLLHTFLYFLFEKILINSEKKKNKFNSIYFLSFLFFSFYLNAHNQEQHFLYDILCFYINGIIFLINTLKAHFVNLLVVVFFSFLNKNKYLCFKKSSRKQLINAFIQFTLNKKQRLQARLGRVETSHRWQTDYSL